MDDETRAALAYAKAHKYLGFPYKPTDLRRGMADRCCFCHQTFDHDTRPRRVLYDYNDLGAWVPMAMAHVECHERQERADAAHLHRTNTARQES